MPAPHDPASLTVHLPAVPSRGVRIAIAADGEALGFGKTDFSIVGPLSLDGRLERLESGGFRLRGRLGGALTIECGRCLAPVALPLEEHLELVWLSPDVFGETTGSRSGTDAAERFLEAADMNVSVHHDDNLRLAETLWEQVHLALPPKPLCARDCLGLCPSCGADRNRAAGGCGCDEERSSRGGTRLGSLGELLAAAPLSR